jgi:hypothetical protein
MPACDNEKTTKSAKTYMSPPDMRKYFVHIEYGTPWLKQTKTTTTTTTTKKKAPN